MAAKRHSIEYLREVAHLRPRTNLIGAVARVRHTLAQALHRFFNEQGFFWVSTPLITASDTEGAGEMFRVSTLDLENLPRNDQGKVDFDKDFFGKESFLTVSGQLNGETYACALSKIYTFGDEGAIVFEGSEEIADEELYVNDRNDEHCGLSLSGSASERL